MTLTWDAVGERTYETGVDRGVLYMPDENGDYINGVAWNGLTNVTETPTGGEANPQYADNIKYLNLYSAEELGLTLEAFTYPDEWQEYDGLAVPTPGVTVGQQTRRTFGLSYRTLKGNDLEGTDYGYKLHLVYGATASPSEKGYGTVNDTPEPINFSWELATLPVAVTGYKPTSIITIDSTDVDATALAALEAILYGEEDDPRLPLPDEVIALLDGTAIATNITVAADVDAVAIGGTTANALFTLTVWDGDSWNAVGGGSDVNEVAAEALVLTTGSIYKVVVSAAAGYYVPAAQQTIFYVVPT